MKEHFNVVGPFYSGNTVEIVNSDGVLFWLALGFCNPQSSEGDQLDILVEGICYAIINMFPVLEVWKGLYRSK